MNPLRLVLLTLAAPTLALAGCLANTSYSADVRFEAEEDGRIVLDGAGQRNCVHAAWSREVTTFCGVTPTGAAFPTEGFLMLDGFYTTVGTPTSPREDLEATLADPTNPSAPGLAHLSNDAVLGGGNTERASGGLVSDVVTPGVGRFMAVYGRWHDANLDGRLDVRMVSSQFVEGNEWQPVAAGVELFSYIEPGSHPSVGAPTKPDAYSPDIGYSYHSNLRIHLQEGYPTVFIDGSILQTLRVETVTDPILAPHPDELFPFTPRPTSLVDIDLYTAIAPEPFATLYGETAAPVVNAVGSPSLADCPNKCAPGPVRSGGTPLAEPQGGLFARYLPEWREGSDSSAAGREEAFEENYAGWIELLPMSAYPGSGGVFQRNGPLLGGERDGEPTMAPGDFTGEVWFGVWWDRTLDGRIGVADRVDPYEGGSRPLPDDYENSQGEFIAVNPVHGLDNFGGFELLLVPDDDWGPGGVWTTIFGVPLSPTQCGAGDPACASRLFTGSEPIVANAYPDVSGRPGHWAFQYNFFMPLGSPGFTVCTPPLTLEFELGGTVLHEVLWDCDHVARWEPPAAT